MPILEESRREAYASFLREDWTPNIEETGNFLKMWEGRVHGRVPENATWENCCPVKLNSISCIQALVWREKKGGTLARTSLIRSSVKFPQILSSIWMSSCRHRLKEATVSSSKPLGLVFRTFCRDALLLLLANGFKGVCFWDSSSNNNPFLETHVLDDIESLVRPTRDSAEVVSSMILEIQWKS